MALNAFLRLFLSLSLCRRRYFPTLHATKGLQMRVSRRRSSTRAPGISSIGKAEQRKREKEHPDQPYQVYVGNLPWKLSEKALAEFCSSVGRVVVAKIKKNPFTGLSKGYGFVRFSDPIFAVAAVERLSGQELQGRPITVKFANAPSAGLPEDDEIDEEGVIGPEDETASEGK
mmetsp:Transcript_4379/g.17212  ORF Transcript_4379/g.17212 Transcript_4379/m.17212 type:complete len:173 (+) Transcript_4379:251-769(+)|eukprot:scaffold635_cov311-Pinguiococcus_pyrenoidosus.AAC.2